MYFTSCRIRSDSQTTDLDNRCALELYEQEGCDQQEYSLCRHRFSDCSCLSWPGRRGVVYLWHICVISRSLPVADSLIDEDGISMRSFIPCKNKRQYLLASQTSRYRFLALQMTLQLPKCDLMSYFTFLICRSCSFHPICAANFATQNKLLLLK